MLCCRLVLACWLEVDVFKKLDQTNLTQAKVSFIGRFLLLEQVDLSVVVRFGKLSLVECRTNEISPQLQINGVASP
jgi:hypothetical protein